MIIKRSLLAPIVFAWTLAAAGMAALAVTVAPGALSQTTLSQPAGPQNLAPAGQIQADAPRFSVKDVQIGERGNQTRIAVLCGGPCEIKKTTGGEFFLGGVEASFELDLSSRSDRLQTLFAEQAGAGAMLSVKTNATVEYANVKNCTVGGMQAACVDLFFAEPIKTAGVTATSVQAREIKTPPVPSPARTREVLKPTPVVQQASATKPSLREGAPERFKTFARLAAPERLEPPVGAILAKVQPIEKTVEVRTPSVRVSEPLAPQIEEDFGVRINAILGKELTSAYCNNAEATLQADAWAMGAMVDVGLCAGARGDAAAAEEILARLLQYTPDNYEAYVGRALIAEQAGEKGVARKYYQDALNAPPPIEESSRIVEALTALQ
ncbi:MAG: hypothetical protein DHS20C05_14990 [Hyphococcus sp.]|nr:MAG: hypothetical protein DHS20C05_14990 [Marinicaulis sp.]